MPMKKFFKIFFLILIFSLGILLHVHAYLLNNSFFTDEILLAFNAISRNYVELILPLDYNQAAPFLFLFLTKFTVTRLGISELAFRFIPFLFGILSIFAFFALSKKNTYKILGKAACFIFILH